MGMREVLLGDPAGTTHWQRLKQSWLKEKAEGERKKALAEAFNPLGLRPADLVEIANTTYEVETVLWYHTEDGDPDYARYGLKNLQTNEVALLEALPTDRTGTLSTALFQLTDEMDLDDDLLAVIENEDELTQEIPGDGEVVWEKDFITTAQVTVIATNEVTRMEVAVFAYARETDGGEELLTVEALPEVDWMAFYRGHEVRRDEVLALGTA